MGAGGVLFDAGADIKAIHIGKNHIEEDEVGSPELHFVDGLSATARRFTGSVVLLKDFLQEDLISFSIVYDKGLDRSWVSHGHSPPGKIARPSNSRKQAFLIYLGMLLKNL